MFLVYVVNHVNLNVINNSSIDSYDQRLFLDEPCKKAFKVPFPIKSFPHFHWNDSKNFFLRKKGKKVTHNRKYSSDNQVTTTIIL